MWYLEDRNEWGGDCGVDEYYEMTARFFEQYGEGYGFRVDEIREQGDLVLVFAGAHSLNVGRPTGC